MLEVPKRPRDRLVREVDVHRYDVLVVGGGIAGVSVAERLAREARRRGKRLRIALVERASKLGDGSSGRLEGWFHTGALYSGLADGQTFATCVKAVERLINWYSKDPLSPCPDNCNLRLGNDKTGPANSSLSVPLTHRVDSDCPWFLPEAPVYYALRQELEGVKTGADAVQWMQRAAQISARIRNAYWEEDWDRDGLAVAPEADRVLKLPESVWVRMEKEEDSRREFRYGDPDPHECNIPDLWRILESYERTGEESVRKLYKTYSSRDAVMDTRQILRDLARAAWENGVEFLFDTEVRGINVPAYGEVCVTGLVGYRSHQDEEKPVHLLAAQYVFALGPGFTDALLREKLGLRLRVKTHKSVMAVLHPPLMEHNFVRMDYYAKNHFNHILRSLGDDELKYSMIANSAFDTDERGQLEKIAESIEGLLETAHRYFPSSFYDHENERRRILWYQCNKTEFFSDDERKRNYIYWTEPEFGEITLPAGAPGSKPETLASRVSDLVHQILIRARSQKTDCTDLYREIDRLAGNARGARKAPPNFLCILPGKYTFFPLLAHQVYVELECRGLFMGTSDGFCQPRSGPEPSVKKPHPVTLLRERREA